MLLYLLIFMLFILLGVAFSTLMERYLLGSSQVRLSANKSLFMGLAQAIFDGLKLLSKESFNSFNSMKMYYYFSPVLIFSFLFLEWMVLPYNFMLLSFNNSILFFVVLIGSLVYFMLFSGLFSVSKFSLLGSLRASSQSISFELSFFFVVFSYMMLVKSLNFYISHFMMIYILLLPLFLLLVLVELGKAPFDFPESESELVSGYNTEYSSLSFVLLFLSEYGFMLFFSVMLSVLFFNCLLILQTLFVILILSVRSVYPRMKYDYLMSFFWFMILPFSMYLVLIFYLFSL